MVMIAKNRTHACNELRSRGYKVAKTKFYKDCCAGLCRVESDGSIIESSLVEYIETAGLKKLGEPYFERKKQAQQIRQGFLVIPVDLSFIREILKIEKSSNTGPSENELNGKQNG